MATEFVIRDGRIIRRDLTEQDLGSQDKLLAEVTKAISFPFITDFKLMLNFISAMVETTVNVIFQGSEILFVIHLPVLDACTYYEAVGGDGYTLVTPKPASEIKKITRWLAYWEPAQGTQEIQSYVHIPHTYLVIGTKDGRMSLMTRHPTETNRWFMTPYSNVQTNGNLCMGSSYQPPLFKTETPTAFMKECLAAFLSIRPNNHLFDEWMQPFYALKPDKTLENPLLAFDQKAVATQSIFSRGREVSSTILGAMTEISLKSISATRYSTPESITKLIASCQQPSK